MRHEAVPVHALELNKRLALVPHGRIREMVGDPSGGRRNQTDKQSVFDNYREYGIFWTAGNNRIEAGISKVFSYMAMGKVKIFSTLKETINEGVNYKYKPLDLHVDKNVSEIPIEVNNHCMDTMRYMINTLPDDHSNLITVKASPLDRQNQIYGYTKQEHIPFALRTEEDNMQDWYSSY